MAGRGASHGSIGARRLGATLLLVSRDVLPIRYFLEGPNCLKIVLEWKDNISKKSGTRQRTQRRNAGDGG
jgi:hypothetical protein